MKKTLLVFISFLFFASTNAQYRNEEPVAGAAKSIYLELGGAGLLATVNFDMRLQKKEDGLGFKVGVGGLGVFNKIDGERTLFVPVGLNYLIGKNKRNYFEVGGGITIMSIANRSTTYNGGVTNTTSINSFSTTFGHAYFGYRLQPKGGGFLFRAGITPIFNSEGFVPYWAGISFGYKF
jgi:hypothetical protein